MDKAVGRMIEYLQVIRGENTLVVFSSDNGPETFNRYKRAKNFYGSPGPLKGMKLWTTEAGFKVPGIIKWLGKETYSGYPDAVVSLLDFFPTFAEISAAKLPDRELDGELLTSLLTNGKFDREKPLLWAFYNARNEHVVAMRDGDWKIMAKLKNDTTYLPKIKNVYYGNENLLKHAELCDFDLFNLNNDIGENENLSEAYPKVLTEMKEKLNEGYKELLRDTHIWNRN